MNKFIIDARQCRSPRQRATDIILISMLWIAYFYLIHETFILIARVGEWLLDANGAWLEHKLLSSLPTLLLYAKVGAINALILYSWAFYNQLRFRGLQKRKSPEAVSTATVADFYCVSEANVLLWRTQRRMVIHHDEYGNLLRIDHGHPADRVKPLAESAA